MPNWTENVLIITGDKAEELVDRIYQKGAGSDFYSEDCIKFSETIPMPEELNDTVSGSDSLKPDWQKERSKEFIEKYGADNWYDWRNKNWGTKWEGSSAYKEILDDCVHLTFQTAWSPPLPWLIRTARLYPSLSFDLMYRGEGGEFHGGLRLSHENEELMFEEYDLTEHDWKMKWDPDYIAEYEFITTGDYSKVIDSYLIGDNDYPSLEEFLLNRIEDQDLPLFINYNWTEQQDRFEERLKG